MEQIRQSGRMGCDVDVPADSPAVLASSAVPAWIPPALLIAAFAYAAWLLSYVLKVNVGTVEGYVSELPATDQPFRWVFGGGDVVAGTLAVLSAATLLATGRRGHGQVRGYGQGREQVHTRNRSERLTRAAWLALAVFGLFTVADVAFPLDCAPSVDAACHAAERAGAVSTAARIHVYTSVLSNAGILIHMGLVAWVAPRAPERWPVLARTAVPVTLLAVLSTLAVLALIPLGNAVGIPQRVSVLCISAWLVLLAADLAYRGRAHRHPAGKHPAGKHPAGKHPAEGKRPR